MLTKHCTRSRMVATLHGTVMQLTGPWHLIKQSLLGSLFRFCNVHSLRYKTVVTLKPEIQNSCDIETMDTLPSIRAVP